MATAIEASNLSEIVTAVEAAHDALFKLGRGGSTEDKVRSVAGEHP
jgi:uncharacterized protein YqgV (UPF0045/DUF77 family)